MKALGSSEFERSKFNAAIHGRKLSDPVTVELPSKESAEKMEAHADELYKELLEKANKPEENGQRP